MCLHIRRAYGTRGLGFYFTRILHPRFHTFGSAIIIGRVSLLSSLISPLDRIDRPHRGLGKFLTHMRLSVTCWEAERHFYRGSSLVPEVC